MDKREIDHLRGELAARLNAHPSQLWSPELLVVLIAVFDLEFPDDGGDGGPKLPRTFRIVR